MRKATIVVLAALLFVSATAGAQDSSVDSDVNRAAAGRPRVGLVLSGGGARGATHIGVLKMLDQLHVPIDVIAGTSMGAVVGGLYASGLSGEQIERAMASLDWQAAFRDRPPRTEVCSARATYPLRCRSQRLFFSRLQFHHQRHPRWPRCHFDRRR